MALLQISEPDEAPPKRSRRRAIGIDLGTTNSLVASVRDDGIAVVLPDDEGRPLVPSIVHYGEGGSEIGHDAVKAQIVDPHNTLVSVKRFMGRGLADLSDARRFPYRFVDGPGMVRVTTRAGDKSPVEASAEILRACARAPRRARRPVDAAVVTVLLRRRATPGDQGRGEARRLRCCAC
jgi:molecular chaperone HscA